MDADQLTTASVAATLIVLPSLISYAILRTIARKQRKSAEKNISPLVYGSVQFTITAMYGIVAFIALATSDQVTRFAYATADVFGSFIFAQILGAISAGLVSYLLKKCDYNHCVKTSPDEQASSNRN